MDQNHFTALFGGGGKSSFPSILIDGNTVAWYDAAESYITKDGSDLVSQWDDRSGNDNHLLQATATNQPLWSSDGVLFDGVDNYLRALFTIEQPEFIYTVLKQVTWVTSGRIFDGSTSVSGLLYQTGSSPNIVAHAGSASSPNTNLAVDTFGIIRLLFNGASSKLIVNDTTPITGDFGSSDMDGLTLGARGDEVTFGNIEVKEMIIRKIADSSTDEGLIYDYLKAKYSL